MLTRAEYEAQGRTATGRPVVVFQINPSSTLYRLKYTDGGQGVFPAKYSGHYTSVKQAQFALECFVKETWDVAEEMLPKSYRKKAI